MIFTSKSYEFLVIQWFEWMQGRYKAQTEFNHSLRSCLVLSIEAREVQCSCRYKHAAEKVTSHLAALPSPSQQHMHYEVSLHHQAETAKKKLSDIILTMHER